MLRSAVTAKIIIARSKFLPVIWFPHQVDEMIDGILAMLVTSMNFFMSRSVIPAA